MPLMFSEFNFLYGKYKPDSYMRECEYKNGCAKYLNQDKGTMKSEYRLYDILRFHLSKDQFLGNFYSKTFPAFCGSFY